MSYKGTSEFIAYVEALEARVEKLEKGMKEIVRSSPPIFGKEFNSEINSCYQKIFDLQDIARKALEGE